MARHRMKKYSRRTRSQYKKSRAPIVLAIIVFLLLSVIISAAVGLSLSRRAAESGRPQKRFDFESADYVSGGKTVRAVEAYQLPKGANAADYISQGISDLSVCVRHADGSLDFYFEAAEHYSKETQGEGSFSALCDTVHSSGGRVCAYIYITSFSVSDEHLRGIAKAYELALIAEAARSGADDILLLGITPTEKNIDELEDHIARASIAAGKAPLGVSVSETLLAASSGYLAPRLREVCDHLALDLTGLGQADADSGRLESLLEKNEYYIKSYPLRILFGSGRHGIYSEAISLGVSDMQTVGK